MGLTYCGVLLNIMVALMRAERDSNEYTDLIILQRIANGYNGSISADITALLKSFRSATHLKVSIEDLYVYFSNMGVFKV